MKAVLISIHPKWCAKIASGDKTIEVRKSAPKLEPPFKCYIYCTKGNAHDPNQLLEVHGADGKIRKANGTVFAEFVCDRIISTVGWRLRGETGMCAKRTAAEKELPNAACLQIEDIELYAGGRNRIIHGWHISDLAIYDEPKPLSAFIVERYPCLARLKRPPQSWCYVEELPYEN